MTGTMHDQRAPVDTDSPRPFRLPNGLTVMQINPAETCLQYRKIFAQRMYLQHGVSVLPGGVVFDVGANIGISALFFHREAPNVRVVSFEPGRAMFEALAWNYATHGIDGEAVNVALGGSCGTRILTIYGKNTSMSSLYAEAERDREVTRTYLGNIGFDREAIHDLIEGLHASHEEPCTIGTLSAIIEDRGIDRIDLLKVNVEKAELEVLAGLNDRHWPLVRQAVVQVHDLDGSVDAARSIFASRGFRTVVTQDEELNDTGIFDVFAIPA